MLVKFQFRPNPIALFLSIPEEECAYSGWISNTQFNIFTSEQSSRETRPGPIFSGCRRGYSSTSSASPLRRSPSPGRGTSPCNRYWKSAFSSSSERLCSKRHRFLKYPAIERLVIRVLRHQRLDEVFRIAGGRRRISPTARSARPGIWAPRRKLGLSSGRSPGAGRMPSGSSRPRKTAPYVRSSAIQKIHPGAVGCEEFLGVLHRNRPLSRISGPCRSLLRWFRTALRRPSALFRSGTLPGYGKQAGITEREPLWLKFGPETDCGTFFGRGRRKEPIQQIVLRTLFVEKLEVWLHLVEFTCKSHRIRELISGKSTPDRSAGSSCLNEINRWEPFQLQLGFDPGPFRPLLIFLVFEICLELQGDFFQDRLEMRQKMFLYETIEYIRTRGLYIIVVGVLNKKIAGRPKKPGRN